MSFEELLKTLGSGLGQFGWNDFLDIAILTVLLYKLIVWTKDTRAYEVIKGVGLLIVASTATQLLGMYTLNWFLSSILQSGTIIIVILILFTPEIRRVLERLGRSGKAIGKLINEAGNMGVEDLIDDLHKTILRLALDFILLDSLHLLFGSNLTIHIVSDCFANLTRLRHFFNNSTKVCH